MVPCYSLHTDRNLPTLATIPSTSSYVDIKRVNITYLRLFYQTYIHTLISPQTNTYRRSFQSVRYLTLHAPARPLNLLYLRIALHPAQYHSLFPYHLLIAVYRYRSVSITFLNYLISYSTEHIPSWSAYSFSACQEISRSLCNPKLCPPPVPVLSRFHPVHYLTSLF
jgi:hypothetical protein